MACSSQEPGRRLGMLPRQWQKQVQRGASSAAPVMTLAPINRKIPVFALRLCFAGLLRWRPL